MGGVNLQEVEKKKTAIGASRVWQSCLLINASIRTLLVECSNIIKMKCITAETVPKKSQQTRTAWALTLLPSI